MGYYSDALKEIIQRSLDLNYWLYIFLATVIMYIVFAITLLVFAIPAAMILVSFGLTASGITALVLLGILLFIVFVFVSTYFEGLLLNLGRNFFDNHELDLGKAFDLTTARIKPAFKVQLILSVVFCLLFLILMLPFIFHVFSGASQISLNPETLLEPLRQSNGNEVQIFIQPFLPFLAKAMLWLVFGIGVFALISAILLPFFLVVKQIPFFEEKSAMDSLKQGIAYAKKNYFKNWIFFLLFLLFSMAVGVAYSLVEALLFLPAKLGLGVFLAGAFGLIYLIVLVIYVTWITGLSNLFSVKIYEMNVPAGKQKSKPVKAVKEKFDKRKGQPMVQPWQKIKPQV